MLDLADAHMLALEYLLGGGLGKDCGEVGLETTVSRIACHYRNRLEMAHDPSERL